MQHKKKKIIIMIIIIYIIYSAYMALDQPRGSHMAQTCGYPGTLVKKIPDLRQTCSRSKKHDTTVHHKK
jgi:hypothetical protein